MAKLKTYLSYFVVALVALQVLNLGLYAQDFETVPVKNGTEANIINSVTEYIAEVMLNKKNAFPEKKERSNQNRNEHEVLLKFQPFKILFYSADQNKWLTAVSPHCYSGFILSGYHNHTSDIISPPPRIISLC